MTMASISAPIFWPPVENDSESAATSFRVRSVSATAVATVTVWSATPRKRYQKPRNARLVIGGRVNVIVPAAPALVKIVPAESRFGLTV